MHCFVSDLHLTEEDLPGSVAETQLLDFVDRLEALSASSGEPVTLVFVGDVVELLRSRRWGQIWRESRSAPWSGAGPGFGNFPDGHAEECACLILGGIRNRYSAFEAKLRGAVSSKTIRTKYLFGNHDFMVQLSRFLRASLIEFLSLDHNPSDQFQSCYVDAEASIVATHGHAADPVNWHRVEDGHWAMGDAVVLRILNEFAERAPSALGLAPGTRLGKLVQDVENVEPILDVPLYIRWLSEAELTAPGDQRTFLATWREVVDEFLAIPHFASPAFGGKPFSDLRTALKWSTEIGLAELVRKVSGLVGASGPDYLASAGALARQSRCRYVIHGHTHDPVVAPIGGPAGSHSFYVNTGCWRRTVSRPARSPGGPFVPRWLSCHFLVHPAAVADGRYQLHQVCQTT